MTATNDFRPGLRSDFASAQKPKRRPFTRVQRVLLVLGISVGVLSILAIVGSLLPTQAMKESAFSDECYSSIERKLRDPESAQIEDPIFGVQVIDEEEDRYEMFGTGRAKNGFGGMASFTYSCTGGYSEHVDRAYANAQLNS